MSFNPDFKVFINPYIPKMAEHGHYILQEGEAQEVRGAWSEKIFKNNQPLHIEIGTGNGFHFAHYADKNPRVSLVGFEIKYKTLVQSIARARVHDCTNARMVLGPVKDLNVYFSINEVEKVIIHFPDPWPKVRQRKNRLLTAAFLRSAFDVLKPGGVLEFKTDHHEYFLFAAGQIQFTDFEITGYTEDLHHSVWADFNFKTQFEDLFLRQNQRINFFSLRKPV